MSRSQRVNCVLLVALTSWSARGIAEEPARQWTIYLAQDKHLDYNWCGSTTEIELRMAELLDYYVDATEKDRVRWNLDGTLWDEVYRRHRGPEGSARLRNAIRRGRLGYAGNYAVLLWGILDTETAIRALIGALPIEEATGVRARTAVLMENPGMTWGVASVLTDSGYGFLGRGIYPLRAESYNRRREPYPLFWWEAPNGKRVLVRWDLYSDTKRWGGYAEGHELSALAGERWSAFQVRSVRSEDDPELFAKRKKFIRETVERYRAYGARYPISSILLLGTGWDNWTRTDDLSRFVERYNAAPDGSIRLVDARYEDFFVAAERELHERSLTLPTLRGSFGICWEEWAAHLAGPTAEFREAQRLLRLAEASVALETLAGRDVKPARQLLRHGVTELLKFAEHDFGGTDRWRAALSAGVRARTATTAMDVARSLAPAPARLQAAPPQPAASSALEPEETRFSWRGGRVEFDPQRCAIVSVVDSDGREWVPTDPSQGLGGLVHTRYRTRAKPGSVFPEPIESSDAPTVRSVRCRRGPQGTEILAEYGRAGFDVESRFLLHEANPWIDITCRLQGGWTDSPQSVELCFPFSLDDATYRYDAPGAILVAGPRDAGGDDLPGANPELFAGVTFAAASSGDRTALLLTPDTLLLRFGPHPSHATSSSGSAQIASMPMMNLTGNDHQFGQGGWREWTFRYRVVLLDEGFDPVRAVQEAQQYGTPPFLWAPGQRPAVPGMAALEIDFPGGPLLAFKVAEDDRRLILRFWNVSAEAVRGSLKVPSGWSSVQSCDALERPETRLVVTPAGRVEFTAAPRGIQTLALSRGEETARKR